MISFTCDERVEHVFVDGHVLLLHELKDGRRARDVAHGAVASHEMLIRHTIWRHTSGVLHPKKEKMWIIFSLHNIVTNKSVTFPFWTVKSDMQSQSVKKIAEKSFFRPLTM